MSTYASDDLAQIVIGEDREFVGYAQGILRQWDPDTFENTVDVRGGVLTNLPVADPIGALTYTPGMVLKLIVWKQRSAGGIATYWIDGSVAFPAEGRAEQGIAFLETQLAKRIARQVMAETMFSASIPLIDGSVNDPGSTYVAGGGPTLPSIEISESGTCLVLITSRINCQINQPTGVSASGWMSFRITGATTVEPSDEQSLHNDIFGPAADVIASTIGATRLVLVEGLNPGLHTFDARYRSEGVDPVPQHAVNFTSRNLTVIAL